MHQHSSLRTFLTALLAVSTIFCGACWCPEEHPDDLEYNKALVIEAFAALDAGALVDLDKYIASDYVRHCQATPEAVVSSLDDFKGLLQEWAGTYSDVETKVDVLVAEGDLVAFCGSFSATQTGPMGPFPATGKHMVSEFAGYHRIIDGKIAETWVTWDNLAALAQLGLFPPPEQGEALSD
jgi:predicted ester cyclase